MEIIFEEKMNKRILIIISILAFAFFGCSEKADKNDEKIVPVKIYKVNSSTISKYIRVTGTVTAEEDVIVYSKVAERIMKINVKPGQHVAKDQIITEQKNDILKQGLEIANSVLKTAAGTIKISCSRL